MSEDRAKLLKELDEEVELLRELYKLAVARREAQYSFEEHVDALEEFYEAHQKPQLGPR